MSLKVWRTGHRTGKGCEAGKVNGRLINAKKRERKTFFSSSAAMLLWPSSPCRTTKQTFADNHDESVVWTVGTVTIFAAIQGCSNKMSSGILATAIDVVIFEIVAHFGMIPSGVTMGIKMDSNNNEQRPNSSLTKCSIRWR